MRRLVYASRFARDLRRAQKRTLDLTALQKIISELQRDGCIDTRHRPHRLAGEWAGYYECHIAFDWLLIYSIDTKTVTLWRTGTHDDLFG